MTTTVLSVRQEHRHYCTQALAGGPDLHIGKVQRCRHGKLQRLYPAIGRGFFWRDLSRIWHPVMYRRAAHALGGR